MTGSGSLQTKVNKTGFIFAEAMAKQTLVFYDGSCRMCVGLSGWLRRLDGKQQFRLEPYQNRELLVQYPQLSPQACEKRDPYHYTSGANTQGCRCGFGDLA